MFTLRSIIIRAWVLIGAAGVLAGCAQTRSPVCGGLADGAELVISAESGAVYSDIARPLRVVMYDRATLAQFGIRQVPVDFEHQMVLLAAMGPAPSAACDIRIRRVWRDGMRLRVEVVHVYPESDYQRRARSSSPYHVVVVPRCELPIENFSSVIPRRAFLDRTLTSR